jgi:hypothetical protein
MKIIIQLVEDDNTIVRKECATWEEAEMQLDSMRRWHSGREEGEDGNGEAMSPKDEPGNN